MTAGVLTILLLFTSAEVFSQSKSFRKLQDYFSPMEDVQDFALGGFLASIAWNFVEENIDHNAVNQIGKVYFMVIPARHFVTKGLTLKGFKRLATKRDHFEELIAVAEQKDNVSLLMASGRHVYRYLLLVESGDEIVVIEFSGNIDPEKLFRDGRKSSI